MGESAFGMKGKWGESFLKSGLPLEHLTQVTFRNLGWHCNPQFEYVRGTEGNEKTWSYIDLVTTSPQRNRDTELSFVIECKYHDLSRYWFFLPYESSGKWLFDDRVLNCGPYQTLTKPFANSILDLAPISSGGIVVSEEGTKQDNAVELAVNQIVTGFVACSLSNMFGYNIDYTNAWDEDRFIPHVTALVPVIVTNARLYRLKAEVTDLDNIRSATEPSEVADEVQWTWYYYDVPLRIDESNIDAITAHAKREPELVYRYPGVEERMYEFSARPNWLAIVNIKALSSAASDIHQRFLKLRTHDVKRFVRPIKKQRRKS